MDETKTSVFSLFKQGILTRNPVLFGMLGLCPALAVTRSVREAFCMSVVVLAVLLVSGLLLSLLRKVIPPQGRLLARIFVIAGLAGMAEMVVCALFPAMGDALGVYLPLTAVSCLLLLCAEKAMEEDPLTAMCDSLAHGIGFSAALLLLAFVRELFGTGKLFAAPGGTGGIQIFGDWFSPLAFFLTPAGAFLTLGLLAAAAQKIRLSAEERARKKQAEREEIDRGCHATLMRDPVSGKIIRRSAVQESRPEPEQPADVPEPEPAEQPEGEDFLLLPEEPADEPETQEKA